ncbi:site-specific integrase [Streptococcus thermophilus]|uniref:site-specific integrase n=1 Tax=Streptococcus thermophilus TaxID=1308 RepID=UPI00321A21BE
MASYRKRSNGWEYRINYYDSTGKRKPKTKGGFRTKSEAIKAAAEMELKLQDNINIDEDITFLNYFKQWGEVYKRPNVSELTFNLYVVNQKQVASFFGDKKLKDITATEYQHVLNQYAETHAHTTVKRFHTQIKACVKIAVHEGYIKRNFCKFAKINAENKGRDVETKFLEIEEYERLIYETSKHPEHASHAALYIIAKTGIRFAECLGLTVDDIDYETGMLSVNKTWDYKNNTGFMPTKTKSSIREIPIDDDFLSFIKKLPKHEDGRLLPNLSNTAANKTLRKIVGCEVRVHSLRHTYASYLIAHDIDSISVSQVLGHENLNITLEVYAHQLQEQKSRNDEKIKQMWTECGRNALKPYG